jgi:hypothetical protein
LQLPAVNQRFWPYPAIFKTNTGGSAWLAEHRGVPLFITAGHAAPKVGSTVLFNNDSGRTVKGLIVAAQSGGGHDYSIALPLGDVSGIKPFRLSLTPANISQELNSFDFPGGIRYLNMPHKVLDSGDGWFKIDNIYNAITKGSSGSVLTDMRGKAYGLISRFDNNGRDIMVYGREGIRAGLTDAVKRIIFDADLREDIISRFPAFGRNYANVLNRFKPADTRIADIDTKTAYQLPEDNLPLKLTLQKPQDDLQAQAQEDGPIPGIDVERIYEEIGYGVWRLEGGGKTGYLRFLFQHQIENMDKLAAYKMPDFKYVDFTLPKAIHIADDGAAMQKAMDVLKGTGPAEHYEKNPRMMRDIGLIINAEENTAGLGVKELRDIGLIITAEENTAGLELRSLRKDVRRERKAFAKRALHTLGGKPITRMEWADVEALVADLNKNKIRYGDLRLNMFIRRNAQSGRLEVTLIYLEDHLLFSGYIGRDAEDLSDIEDQLIENGLLKPPKIPKQRADPLSEKDAMLKMKEIRTRIDRFRAMFAEWSADDGVPSPTGRAGVPEDGGTLLSLDNPDAIEKIKDATFELEPAGGTLVIINPAYFPKSILDNFPFKIPEDLRIGITAAHAVKEGVSGIFSRNNDIFIPGENFPLTVFFQNAPGIPGIDFAAMLLKGNLPSLKLAPKMDLKETEKMMMIGYPIINNQPALTKTDVFFLDSSKPHNNALRTVIGPANEKPLFGHSGSGLYKLNNDGEPLIYGVFSHVDNIYSPGVGEKLGFGNNVFHFDLGYYIPLGYILKSLGQNFNLENEHVRNFISSNYPVLIDPSITISGLKEGGRDIDNRTNKVAGSNGNKAVSADKYGFFWEQAAPEKFVLRIAGDNQMGSAVLVEYGEVNLLLTDSHVLDKAVRYEISNSSGELIGYAEVYKDFTDRDFAALIFSEIKNEEAYKDLKAVKVKVNQKRNSLEEGEEVLLVGYSDGKFTIRRGFVQKTKRLHLPDEINPHLLYLDEIKIFEGGPMKEGSSGGAVFRKNGDFVGMIQSRDLKSSINSVSVYDFQNAFHELMWHIWGKKDLEQLQSSLAITNKEEFSKYQEIAKKLFPYLPPFEKSAQTPVEKYLNRFNLLPVGKQLDTKELKGVFLSKNDIDNYIPPVSIFGTNPSDVYVYRGMRVPEEDVKTILTEGLLLDKTLFEREVRATASLLGAHRYAQGMFTEDIERNKFLSEGKFPVIVRVNKNYCEQKKCGGKYCSNIEGPPSECFSSKKDIPLEAIADVHAFLDIEGETRWVRLSLKDGKLMYTPVGDPIKIHDYARMTTRSLEPIPKAKSDSESKRVDDYIEFLRDKYFDY